MQHNSSDSPSRMKQKSRKRQPRRRKSPRTPPITATQSPCPCNSCFRYSSDSLQPPSTQNTPPLYLIIVPQFIYSQVQFMFVCTILSICTLIWALVCFLENSFTNNLLFDNLDYIVGIFLYAADKAILILATIPATATFSAVLPYIYKNTFVLLGIVSIYVGGVMVNQLFKIEELVILNYSRRQKKENVRNFQKTEIREPATNRDILNKQNNEQEEEQAQNKKSCNQLILMRFISGFIHFAVCCFFFYVYVRAVQYSNYSLAFSLSMVLIQDAFLLVLFVAVKGVMENMHKDNNSTRYTLYITAPILFLPSIFTLLWNGQMPTDQEFAVIGCLVFPFMMLFMVIPGMFEKIQGCRRLFLTYIFGVLPYGFLFLFSELQQDAFLHQIYVYYFYAITALFMIDRLYSMIFWAYKHRRLYNSMRSFSRLLLKSMSSIRDKFIINNIVCFCVVEILLIFLLPHYQNSSVLISAYLYSLYFEILSLYLCFILLDASTYNESKTRLILFFFTVIGVIVAFVLVFKYKFDSAYVIIPVSELIVDYCIFEIGVYVIRLSKQYVEFTKMVYLNTIYWVLFVPFFVAVPIGFNLLDDNQNNFFFIYVISGFIYVTGLVTLFGVAAHLVLNVTESTSKSLFIIKQMEAWMEQMRIKKDSDKVLSIAFNFEKFQENPKKLFDKLKAGEIVNIKNLEDIQEIDDYLLEDPIERTGHKKLTEMPEGDILLGKIAKTQEDISDEEQEPIPFKERIKQRIQQKRVEAQKNRTYEYLSDLENIVNVSDVTASLIKSASVSSQFVQSTSSYLSAAKHMRRLFHIYSTPLGYLDFQRFEQMCLTWNLQKGITTPLKTLYTPYALNGQMDEKDFREFVFKLCESIYKDTAIKKLPKFVEEYCFMQYYLSGVETIYLIFRKDVVPAGDNIWSVEFMESLQKQRRGKIAEQKLKLAGLLPDEPPKNTPSDNQKVLKKAAKGSNLKGGGKKQEKKTEPRRNNKQRAKKNSQRVRGSLNDMSVNTWFKSSTEKPIVSKKDKKFESAQSIYAGIVRKMVEIFTDYRKVSNDVTVLKSFDYSLGNILAISTRLFDFGVGFLWVPVATFYEYSLGNVTSTKPTTSYFSLNLTFGIIIFLAILYILLLLYHDKDFKNGTYGLNSLNQELSYTSPKYYTTNLVFILGSSLTGIILSNAISVFLCGTKDNKTYYVNADSSIQCFSNNHIILMVLAVLVMHTYYPLAVIVFPFTNSIDRSKQIKYKAEFEVLFMQAKLLVAGLRVIFSSLTIQTNLIVVNLSVSVICSILYYLFMNSQPCSVESINQVEELLYMLCAWISASAALCKFLNYIICASIAGTGVLLYFLYQIYNKSRGGFNNDQRQDNFDALYYSRKVRENNLVKMQIEEAMKNSPGLEEYEGGENYKNVNQELQDEQDSSATLAVTRKISVKGLP